MPLRLLMLATDAHGGFGGIAQYNRDVLDALSALDQVARVVVVPRLLAGGDAAASAPGGLPPKVAYDLSGTTGRLAFIRASLRQALTGGGFDLIYCAHINLLPVAALVSRLTRAPLLLAIYAPHRQP